MNKHRSPNKIESTDMSGYTGRPDDESEHAMILVENEIDAVRKQIAGPVFEDCEDCGDPIDQRRVQYMKVNRIRCTRCITCQQIFDKKPKARIKMLDYIL